MRQLVPGGTRGGGGHHGSGGGGVLDSRGEGAAGARALVEEIVRRANLRVEGGG